LTYVNGEGGPLAAGARRSRAKRKRDPSLAIARVALYANDGDAPVQG
jgi:hypothetical protein